MKMRDVLGTIYQDEAFAHLFPQNGRPVEAPWRLAFITVVQFIEGLPDRQAADAVRGRIDLKDALGLELSQDFAQKGAGVTCLCEEGLVKGNLTSQSERRTYPFKSEQGGSYATP